MTGIHRRHLSEMENAKRPIGKENAKKLAKALNCDYRMML
jgi:plasmid maintenance system antidote protein VapI